jgi:iron-sulfur cluster repair protein YtfE (RIC family)
MPIVIGARRESDFTDPIGMLGDCHRRIERFLEVLVRVTEQAHGGPLSEEERAAFDKALLYFREGAPKHTADEEESLFPRLRRVDSDEVRMLLARIDSLEEQHISADQSHREVDRLGRQWLKDGGLPPEAAQRLLTVLVELREMYRQHISAEEEEVFPTAAAALSAIDRKMIGREMASRRGIADAVKR